MVKPPSLTSMSSLSEIIGPSAHTSASPYVPDYTVRAITDLQYIRIRRAHYMVALHATLLERQRKQAQSDGSQGVGYSFLVEIVTFGDNVGGHHYLT